MDIVKAFTANNMHTEIVIHGTMENPLFRASDVALVLDMKNIRTILMEFDETEKVVRKVDTLGGAQEVNFLTEVGLYRVLFRSNKPIARQFQKWAASVIKEIRLNEKFELTKQLEEKTTELAKLQKRNQTKFERGDRVYVYEDYTENMERVYKIGTTRNMTERAIVYDMTRFENRMKFETMCVDGRILESVVHHMLRVSRDGEKKEWFHTDLQSIINTINLAKCVLDDMPIDNKDAMKQIYNHVNDMKAQEQKIEDTETELSIVENKYEKFIKECCVEGEFTTRAIELSCRFRLWNKGLSRTEGTELNEFLRKKYTFTGRIWNAKTKTTQAGFKGVKLNEYTYTPLAEERSVYDEYITEMCQISPIARVPIFTITQDFIKWKESKGLTYLGEKREKINMRQHLIKHFLPISGGMFYDNKRESGGVWGITLKDNDLDDACHSSAGRRKKVYKIDPQTKEVLETYTTVIECSIANNNDMYHKVKNQILHEGFLYSYDAPTNDIET